MKHLFFGIAAIQIAFSALAAEVNEIPQKTTWIGNTWAGGDSWMQDYVADMVVDGNGLCRTNSSWDEGHNERGIYAWKDGQWHVKVNRGDEAPAVSAKVLKIGNIQWSIDGKTGAVSGGGQTLAGIVKASALGLYRPKNYLMVADDGPGQHVIKFFDVSGKPTLVKTFGEVGGIGAAGTPGEVTKTKFWGLTGCGSDAAGNLYICISEEGVILRRFPVKDAAKLDFDTANVAECHGLHFMDNAGLDPASDGREIWGKQEHYLMDYSKPPGKQWTLVGYTVDKDKYPDDPRLKNQVSMKVRYKNGVRFLYSLEQNANCLNIYRFDGKIAVHALSIKDAKTVDANCDVWFIGDGIQVMRCTGIDGEGKPIYAPMVKFCDTPIPPFKKVKNLLYDCEHDIMFLAGGTEEHPEQGGSHPGPVVCRYTNWSTTRDKTWEIVVPWFHNDAPVPDRIVPQTWDFAGERLYFGYVIGDGDPWPVKNHDIPGVIRVYHTKNGEFMGRLMAGPEVFRGACWIDLAHAIDAFERVNGEHLILREEAWKNKNIMFSYFPEGENPPTTINKVKLRKTSEGDFFMNDATLEFDADVEMVSGSVTKMELYADGKLLASDSSAPWQFSATTLPVGREITFRAVAYDNSGGKGFSNRIYLRISDGSPDVVLKSPGEKSKFLTTDVMEFKASVVPHDAKAAKVEFFADGRKLGETSNPDIVVTVQNPGAGNLQLLAVATDDKGRTGKSDPIAVAVSGPRPPNTVRKPAPGVRYRYYEGDFATLPDFDKLGSWDVGSQPNFSLDKHLRSEKFGFRFDGYLKIDKAGAYTFSTRSNDGSKLFIGGDLVVNNDGNHGMEEKSGRINLEPGCHQFTLDYAQGGDQFGLEVFYEGPGIAKTQIRDGMLSYEPDSLVSPIPVSSVNISRKNFETAAGHSWLLRATVEPSKTWSKRVLWSSSNPSVATVEPSGYVTTHRAGRADIIATSGDGSKNASCELKVTPDAVPEPWLLRNIGAINLFGSAVEKNNEFTITGAGGDIFGNYDEFAFLSRPVRGDATIVTRVTSQTNTNEWAKSGLMFREGNTGSNKLVMFGVTPEHGLIFFWRDFENGWCDLKGLDDKGDFTFPVWLKLEKTGKTFTAYKSSDGTSWNHVATREMPEEFGNGTRVGLAVNSHNGGKLGTAVFDQVKVGDK